MTPKASNDQKENEKVRSGSVTLKANNIAIFPSKIEEEISKKVKLLE